MKSGALVALVAAGLALVPLRSARADDPPIAAATVLFDEGVKLMDAGRHAEACPKLARSQALAPNGGTLLALGDCYEKIGRTASAWVAFREAATRAASAGKREAEASALERARKLESTLPRITLTVPPATQTPGLEVRRDGAVVKEAELGVAVPADPGSHEIQASAPHMKTFTKTITAVAGATVDLAIPKLANETAGGDAPVVEAPPPPVDNTSPPPTAPTPIGSTQRIVGVVVAGVGAASLVTGGVFGLLAKSKNDEALQKSNCPDATHCTQHGLDLTSQARTRALVSTILVAVGGTGLAVGAVVFFTAPKASASAASATSVRRVVVAPSVGLGSAGGVATVIW